jgi:hypothetical protein
MGDAPALSPLFFDKKSLNKTEMCAGALSCRQNHLLVLHFRGGSLLIAFLSIRRTSMYEDVAIPVNYTSEFLQITSANLGNFLETLLTPI